MINVTLPTKIFKQNNYRDFPTNFLTAIKNVYTPADLKVTSMTLEAESSDYGACRFVLNGYHIVFRIAKTTPTKLGQFVTLWKRPTPVDKIAPIDTQDGVDFIVVEVFDGINRGQFVFGKDILVSKGIMSTHSKGGKRAIRVYPPWTKPVAKDAIKNQQWQVHYFFPINVDGTTDSTRICKLFGLRNARI